MICILKRLFSSVWGTSAWCCWGARWQSPSRSSTDPAAASLGSLGLPMAGAAPGMPRPKLHHPQASRGPWAAPTPHLHPLPLRGSVCFLSLHFPPCSFLALCSWQTCVKCLFPSGSLLPFPLLITTAVPLLGQADRWPGVYL